jgi:type IV fimbrial biogenesis protein FimT
MLKIALRRSHSGLTLIELMTTMSVSLILIAVGIPGVSSLLANNTMVASTNDLVTHLQYARSEAVKRQQPVSVCSSSDGLTCANSTEWGTGWIVFTDEKGTAGSLDAGDTLLRVSQPIGEMLSIISDQKYVRYLGDGSVAI